MVELQFTDAVIPLITRLSEQYTEYELKQVSELQSEYSIRLYELMMQWKKVGQTNKIAIDDLRKKLGVEPEQYQRMNNFKARVLDHAIGQINSYTDIEATYKQHKTGKAITAISFKFKQKAAPKQTAIDDGFIKMTDKQISTFSNKLAVLTELGSNSPIGASTEQFAAIIADDLKDPIKQQSYIKHLGKVGYQAAKAKDK
ncbi:MAG: RepB family plasmid replication initiator protein, partial [Methylophagaceae bacterium]